MKGGERRGGERRRKEDIIASEEEERNEDMISVLNQQLPYSSRHPSISHPLSSIPYSISLSHPNLLSTSSIPFPPNPSLHPSSCLQIYGLLIRLDAGGEKPLVMPEGGRSGGRVGMKE